MNPAWPSALLCLALTGSVAAGEADELRKLGAGVFTTAGKVTDLLEEVLRAAEADPAAYGATP